MWAPEEDGAPLLDHLLAVQRQTGQVPQMLLDAPECPDDGLWQVFLSLHNGRSWIMGPGRIGYSDIDAYQRVMRTRLQPWEIEAISRADTAFLKGYADRQPNPNP